MSTRLRANIPTDQVTPPEVFFGRRKFLSLLGAGTISGARCFPARGGGGTQMLEPPLARPEVFPAARNDEYRLPGALQRRQLTPREAAGSHNNFYEFLPGQGDPVWKHTDVFEVDPGKYGYKSPKSIVNIELLKKQPRIFWQIQSHEYGFLSNVNPNILHPRWSQAKSYWLDTQEAFSTPIFNGYEDHLASMYPNEPRTLQPSLAARPDCPLAAGECFPLQPEREV